MRGPERANGSKTAGNVQPTEAGQRLILER